MLSLMFLAGAWTLVLGAIGVYITKILTFPLGELGTPASATISPATTDTIAWIVAGIAILLGAAALARPRFGRASASSSRK